MANPVSVRRHLQNRTNAVRTFLLWCTPEVALVFSLGLSAAAIRLYYVTQPGRARLSQCPHGTMSIALEDPLPFPMENFPAQASAWLPWVAWMAYGNLTGPHGGPPCAHGAHTHSVWAWPRVSQWLHGTPLPARVFSWPPRPHAIMIRYGNTCLPRVAPCGHGHA